MKENSCLVTNCNSHKSTRNLVTTRIVSQHLSGILVLSAPNMSSWDGKNCRCCYQSWIIIPAILRRHKTFGYNSISMIEDTDSEGNNFSKLKILKISRKLHKRLAISNTKYNFILPILRISFLLQTLSPSSFFNFEIYKSLILGFYKSLIFLIIL